MPVLLRASKMTCKHTITVYSDTPITQSYFKGSVSIDERIFTGKGRSSTIVNFMPDEHGDYYYFAVQHCYPVDGAIIVAEIPLDKETSIQIFKLADHAVIKKRNLLSREMEILYFHNGSQVFSDSIRDRPPRSINSSVMDLSAMPPEPSVMLKDFIRNLKRY